MKNYFPMKTFQQDAVVRRLNVLYKLLKDVDVEYSEAETPVATFTLDGNVEIEEDLTVKGDLDVTGDVIASSYGGFGSENNGKALVVNSNGVAVPQSVPGVSHIYWHGLDIYKAGVNSVQAHILSNSNSSINSIQALKNWVLSLGVSIVKLSCGGTYVLDGVAKTAYMIRFRVSQGEIIEISLYYVGTTGYLSIDITETFDTEFNTVEDDVNTVL